MVVVAFGVMGSDHSTQRLKTREQSQEQKSSKSSQSDAGGVHWIVEQRTIPDSCISSSWTRRFPCTDGSGPSKIPGPFLGRAPGHRPNHRLASQAIKGTHQEYSLLLQLHLFAFTTIRLAATYPPSLLVWIAPHVRTPHLLAARAATQQPAHTLAPSSLFEASTTAAHTHSTILRHGHW